MKLAIMQPYFLPYIGYFQLMAAVDRFVLLDDVNYINRGWINRNRIPSGTGARWMTLPLVGASQNKFIRDIEILPDDGWKQGLGQIVRNTYANAPEAVTICPMVHRWLALATGNLSTFLHLCLQEVAAYLGLSTHIISTSSIYPKNGLKGQQRILDICLREEATTYVNLPGGVELYDRTAFANAGVELAFLKPQLDRISISQAGSADATLSILHLMMTNSRPTLSASAGKVEFAQC
jgi:hypothetical protein